MYVHWAHAYCDCRYEVENISIYLSIYLGAPEHEARVLQELVRHQPQHP